MLEVAVKSKRLVFASRGACILEEAGISSPGFGEVLVEAAFSTLSPGTERSLMLGKFKPLPLNAGYSMAGRIAKVGEGVSGLAEGDAVVTTGPHASHFIADARFVTPVPANVDLAHAAFFNLAHTAIFGVRQAKIQLGEPVLVIGQGLVGLLAAKFAKLSGALPVIGVDLSEERLGVSENFGIPVRINANDEGALTRACDELPGGGPAAVLEVTGALAPIEQATRLVRKRGRVVLLASPNRDDPIDVYRALSFKGASLVGAYVNAKPWSLLETNVELKGWPPNLADGYAPHVSGNVWTSDDDVRVFLNALRYGALDLAPLISHQVNPEGAPELYDLVYRGDPELLGGIINWS